MFYPDIAAQMDNSNLRRQNNRLRGLLERALPFVKSDTNASGCGLSEKGGYCPNDLAETLRAVAKVARATLSKKDNQNG